MEAYPITTLHGIFLVSKNIDHEPIEDVRGVYDGPTLSLRVTRQKETR